MSKYHNAGSNKYYVYVQKHIAPLAVCDNPTVVRDKPLGASAFVKLVYCIQAPWPRHLVSKHLMILWRSWVFPCPATYIWMRQYILRSVGKNLQLIVWIPESSIQCAVCNNECCYPCTFNISNVNFTNNVYIYIYIYACMCAMIIMIVMKNIAFIDKKKFFFD